MTFRIYHPGDIDAHPSMPGHPERVHRLWAAMEGGHCAKIGPREFCEALPADLEVTERLHGKPYIDLLVEAASKEARHTRLDGGDTYLTPSSLKAALCGVGGSCAAIDDLMHSRISGAMVMSRPPGHHATRSEAMGFCLLGTAALAAAHAQSEHGLRVALLDFDLHHFNGSEDLLWGEQNMFLASTHQAGIWPMTGGAESKGAHGQILNNPLPQGSGGSEMRTAWSAIFDRVRAFEPGLIIVSAGFDAHADDPLSGLNWSFDDYRWLGDQIGSLASDFCEGRVLSILEGGYDLSALRGGVTAYLEGLHPGGAQTGATDALKAPVAPYLAPELNHKRGVGLACVKAFSRLWIQDLSTGNFVYAVPEFLRLTSRRDLIELAETASNAGGMRISDIISFEHSLKRGFGYRQRTSKDF